jgi:acyl carrier protein
MQVTPHRLRQFIADNFLFAREVEVTDDTSFLETGVIDSTGMLEIISFLEQEYGISIDTQELIPENLDSVNRIVAYLERKLKVAELARAVA